MHMCIYVSEHLFNALIWLSAKWLRWDPQAPKARMKDQESRSSSVGSFDLPCPPTDLTALGTYRRNAPLRYRCLE